MKTTHLLAILLFLLATNVYGQKDPAWDNTTKTNWPSVFQVVDIPSSKDGKMQKAYLHTSTSKLPQPLIVSLHTWSGDYTQKDPLTEEILARNWNYIHPNFRGSNNHPEAMGSAYVLADIEDAIRYAVQQTNADPANVHIVGVSGGGYATLLAYMNVQYPVKSFSAWAPISDIEAWYWESVGRKQKYADDILKALSPDGVFDKGEALRRSPLVHSYPKELRKDARLYIYEGIHDGYKGSVPITHSIHMYNRLASELTKDTTYLVSDKEIIDLVTKRYNPFFDKTIQLFGRDVYLNRSCGNLQLVLFEGGHEQLPEALELLPIN